jgi:hypothetical protein
MGVVVTAFVPVPMFVRVVVAVSGLRVAGGARLRHHSST